MRFVSIFFKIKREYESEFMSREKRLKESNYTHVIHPFPALYDADSKILILGSLPSVKSREQNFFYGHPVTYKEARVYLDEMSKYGSVLGLDTIRGLLRELGNPQDDLKFIHIAGTNGKGSVLAYTSTILSKAGYRTGRYVSPTVISYLEKIQMMGNGSLNQNLQRSWKR